MAFAAASLSRAPVWEAAIQRMIEIFAVEQLVLFETFHYQTQLRYIAFAMTEGASEVFAKGACCSDRTAFRFFLFRHSFASLRLAPGSARFLCVREEVIDGRCGLDVPHVGVGDRV